MQAKQFEQLVVEALDSLPPEFAHHLDNVEILIEDRPSDEDCRRLDMEPGETLYGLYEGIPLTERSSGDLLDGPTTIIIFREPLVRDFTAPAELREEVRRTVLHELAHHFGIDDERLDELGAY